VKLEEAIRINTVLKGAPVLKDDPKVIAALNLSNEALKRLKEHREELIDNVFRVLPGETED